MNMPPPATVVFHPRTEPVALGAGETLLEAAQRMGLRVPHSCRGGNCGSCRMTLLAGAVDYPRFAPLTPPGLIGATPGLDPGAVEVLACQAVPRGAVQVEPRELRRAGEVEVKKLPCRVARCETLSPGVLGLWLRLPAAEPLEFHAGQYVNLWLGDGRQRSFSIAAPPHASSLVEVHIRESASMEASGVLGQLREGSLLTIEGPHGVLGSEVDTGLAPTDAAAKAPVVLVAGGTGYAPMQALLWQWLESGTQRPVVLYWGVRAAEDLYRDTWLRERAARFTQFRYVPVLSVAAEGDSAELRRGFVHEAVRADWPALCAGGLTPEVVAAGPTVMVDAVRLALSELAAAGYPVGALTCDAYG
jgi:CDP-4-dehydro-6-deoxyglucose reductase